MFQFSKLLAYQNSFFLAYTDSIIEKLTGRSSVLVKDMDFTLYS